MSCSYNKKTMESEDDQYLSVFDIDIDIDIEANSFSWQFMNY